MRLKDPRDKFIETEAKPLQAENIKQLQKNWKREVENVTKHNEEKETSRALFFK